MISPLKIEILERWEKIAFHGLDDAYHKLKMLNDVCIDTSKEDGKKYFMLTYALVF